MGPEEPVGFGLVGLGAVAATHARAIQALAAEHPVRLAGVASRSADRARDFAARFGAPFHTGEMAALLARPDVHAVCILTPSGAHLEPALQAIAAGKHVVVEKPLEITVARVDALLAAAERAGVLVAGIFQARFSAGARALKAAAQAGRFGRLVLCSAYVKWHRDPGLLHRLEGHARPGRRRRAHQPGHPRRGPAAVGGGHAQRGVRLDCAPGPRRDRGGRHRRGRAPVRPRRARRAGGQHGRLPGLGAPDRDLRRAGFGGHRGRPHRPLGIPGAGTGRRRPAGRKRRRPAGRGRARRTRSATWATSGSWPKWPRPCAARRR